MFQILFVCTANVYRSPLAAAFFAQKVQADGQSKDWIVESAGTWAIPGQSIPSFLLESAGRLDVDLRGHLTRPVDPLLLDQSDLILVMEKGQKEALRAEFPSIQGKVYLLSEMADQWEYDIADPIQFDLDMNTFVAEIARLIHRAYPKICTLVTCKNL